MQRTGQSSPRKQTGAGIHGVSNAAPTRTFPKRRHQYHRVAPPTTQPTPERGTITKQTYSEGKDGRRTQHVRRDRPHTKTQAEHLKYHNRRNPQPRPLRRHQGPRQQRKPHNRNNRHIKPLPRKGPLRRRNGIQKVNSVSKHQKPQHSSSRLSSNGQPRLPRQPQHTARPSPKVLLKQQKLPLNKVPSQQLLLLQAHPILRRRLGSHRNRPRPKLRLLLHRTIQAHTRHTTRQPRQKHTHILLPGQLRQVQPTTNQRSTLPHTITPPAHRQAHPQLHNTQ